MFRDTLTSYEISFQENIYMVMGIIPGGDLWSLMHYQDDNGEWQSGMPESKAKFYALILADTLVSSATSSIFIFSRRKLII